MTVMAAEAGEAAGSQLAAKTGATGARSRAQQRAAAGAQAYGTQAAYIGRNASIPGNRQYQPVLLAEFLAAVVILTLAPIASGGSPEAQAKQSLSPYATSDLTQLVAVGGVYFVLALASSGNSGRVSAWLGGLILIAIAMGKLAGGQLGAVLHPWAGPKGGVEQFGPSADPFGTPGQGGVAGFGDTAGGAV